MAVRTWRIALLVVGVALLGIGGIVLMQEVNPKKYVGILAWFLGALIIHDGIIAPIVFLVTVVMRRRLQRVPAVVVAIIQGTLVIGAIVTLLVVPEIMKKAIGTLSSSILPQNYALHLAVFLGVLVALAVLAIVAYRLMFTRRQKLLSSASQA